MFDINQGLEAVLTGVSRDVFLKEYWETKPLYIERPDPLFYSNLFSVAEFDRLIAFSEIAYPNLRAIHKQKPEPSLQFMKHALSREETFIAQTNTAYKLYSEGCTLFIEGLERRSEQVRLLCRILGNELSHYVSVNAYATPIDSQGFDVHFDDHDVMILQIDGAKHWEVHAPDYPLPLFPSPDDNRLSGAELQNVLKITLRAGDVLYIPRGWRHSARAGDQASLHLTVGIHVFHWMDLIREALVDLSNNDVRFRQALPVGFLKEQADVQTLQTQFQQLLGVFLAGADITNAESNLARQLLRRSEPTINSRMADLNSVSQIDMDTELEKPPATFCRIIEEGRFCRIVFHGKEIGGPAKIASALRFISSHQGVFSGRQVPGDLSESEVLVLLKKLTKEGLLQRAAPPSPNPRRIPRER